MFACTSVEKTGLPDMACINWPGTYSCIDSAVMKGGNSYEWQLLKVWDKNHYLDSITRCSDLGIPGPVLPLRYSKAVYVLDQVFICGGFSETLSKEINKCFVLDLKSKQIQELPAKMKRYRRYMTLTYVENKVSNRNIFSGLYTISTHLVLMRIATS